MRLWMVITALAAASLAPSPTVAQSATATLSGTVVDASGAAVPRAAITVVNEATGGRRTAETAADGRFSVSSLPPSSFLVVSEKEGFQKSELSGVVLEVGEQVTVQITLSVASVTESVTVSAQTGVIRTTPGVSTVVDREFVRTLPMNGRSFQSLIELTPGVVPTTATTTQQGQFSINGARESANTFNVDGVSANIGLSGSGANFNGASGQFGGYNAVGATTGLVSLDALQEFTVQTSGFAPEYGRTPGGQISIVTRSGNSRLSGAAFEYFRHNALDANDFFANSLGLPQQQLRNNQFGGVLGGPLRIQPRAGAADDTFFFVSYEGLRQRLPTVTTVDVPSRAARSAATGASAEILNAFPQPTGPDAANGLAQFSGGYSTPARADATSVRIDRTLSKAVTVFGRYNYAPSQTTTRGQFSNSLSVLVPTDLDIQTLTVAATAVLSARVVNDARLNISRTAGLQIRIPDDYGGARIPDQSMLFPDFVSPDDSVVAVNLRGAGAAPTLYLGSQGSNSQRQMNIVDTLSLVAGSHQLKFGIDYRRLSPQFDFVSYQQTLNFADINSVVRGEVATSSTVQGFVGPFHPRFTNFSAFAQDAWSASSRLTVTYGARYELNPAPSERNGNDPRTITAVAPPGAIALAPEGTAPFSTTYFNIAPRVGVAYTLSPHAGRETVVRGGAGVFYDAFSTQTGAAYRAFSYPYAATRSVPAGTPYPLPAAIAAMPPFTTAPPYNFVYGSDPDLKLPYTVETNAGVDHSLGPAQNVSATYIRGAGRRLYRTEFYLNQVPNFSQLRVVRNLDFSDYHALQLQFRRRLSNGLQMLAHYTLSKSTDTSSSEALMYLPVDLSPPEQNLGPSDFDRRHAFAVAATYAIPAPAGPLKSVFSNFWIDGTYKALSAAPVDVTSSSAALGLPVRPDAVPGVPLVVDDATVPGGWRFNRAAFVARTNNHGTLPRNALRGFALFQLDAALRRRVPLRGRTALEFRVEAYNVFNRPNFASPSGALTSSTFGVATQMLNRNLGGLNALYQIGGPRSVQLAVRVEF
jgi:Carboxypeptidase regulatory-like domain/TonB-dependent Receptor Plug Domain